MLGGPKRLALLCLRMGSYLYWARFPFLGGEGVEAKVWGVRGKWGLLNLFPGQHCGRFLPSLLSWSWLSNFCYTALGSSDAHFRMYYKRYFDGENHPNEEFVANISIKCFWKKKKKFKPKSFSKLYICFLWLYYNIHDLEKSVLEIFIRSCQITTDVIFLLPDA